MDTCSALAVLIRQTFNDEIEKILDKVIETGELKMEQIDLSSNNTLAASSVMNVLCDFLKILSEDLFKRYCSFAKVKEYLFAAASKYEIRISQERHRRYLIGKIQKLTVEEIIQTLPTVGQSVENCSLLFKNIEGRYWDLYEEILTLWYERYFAPSKNARILSVFVERQDSTLFLKHFAASHISDNEARYILLSCYDSDPSEIFTTSSPKDVLLLTVLSHWIASELKQSSNSGKNLHELINLFRSNLKELNVPIPKDFDDCVRSQLENRILNELTMIHDSITQFLSNHPEDGKSAIKNILLPRIEKTIGENASFTRKLSRILNIKKN